MVDRDEVMANFTMITAADHGTAMGILEATGYDLEQGVQLYFATHGEYAAPAAAAAAPPMPHVPPAGAHGGPVPQDLPQGMQGIPQHMPYQEEEVVRAPLPVMRDRLYGNDFAVRRGVPPPDAPREVEAFRDFRAESSSGGDGNGLSNDGAGPGGGMGATNRRQGLAGLFQPPRDLIFSGGFEQAKEAALQQSRWLLVNVQSNSEFASHLLNRDVWGDSMVRSLIQGSFIFWQVYDTSEAGQKVKAFYRLFELPVTMVIDPVTGAALKSFTGAIEAHRLVEDLVPYMDHSIHDPGAAQLSAGHLKRKQAQPDTASKATKPLTEDEELAMALAMSAEDAQPTSAGGAAAAGDGTMDAEAAAANGLSAADGPSSLAPELRTAAAEAEPDSTQQQSAEEASAAAAARLPPEPAAGQPGACPVAVRFPDGQRRSRSFPGEAYVEALRDFCIAHSPEAAGGRSFSLSVSFPGAPQLSNAAATLAECQLANALLVMRWAP